jgi:hypothetical protein
MGSTWALSWAVLVVLAAAVEVEVEDASGALLLRVQREPSGLLRWDSWNASSVDWALSRLVQLRGTTQLSCLVEGRSCSRYAHTLVLVNKSSDEADNLVGLAWMVDCAPVASLSVRYARGPTLHWLKASVGRRRGL